MRRVKATNKNGLHTLRVKYLRLKQNDSSKKGELTAKLLKLRRDKLIEKYTQKGVM